MLNLIQHLLQFWGLRIKSAMTALEFVPQKQQLDSGFVSDDGVFFY